MTHLAYLIALLVPMTALAVVDRRWRLALWADPVRAVLVLVVGVLVFLGWDLLALQHGFYGRGHSTLTTGVDVVPRLPVEEVVFVLFFCYLALVLHRLVHRLLVAASERKTPEETACEAKVRSR